MDVNTGDWERLRALGSGAFGIVSLWRNTRSSKIIALKMCRNDGAGLDSKTRDNWQNEVACMKQLKHKNIIKILDLPPEFAKKTKLPILCMEFCSRGDLRKELCRDENICGLPEESIRAILWDVKSGIEYLHSNKIIHRDLKPENIVLQEIPDGGNIKIVYKLIDLGFAKEWDQSSLSSTIVGTLQYIAPELLIYNKEYSRSVDYWSFGLVCHEIITGFRPFLPNLVPYERTWVESVRNKSNDHICIYETVEGTIEYKKEILPENHITQPLKYALEGWLRIALKWDGSARGAKQRNDPRERKEIIIFSSLEDALNKKIVTVYCVKRLEKLSYEIDESTLIGTLKQWIERDTEIAVKYQLLLLPSGNSLEANEKPVQPHLDNDPKLVNRVVKVAMLYVFSLEDGVRLPEMETLRMKHPPLVIKMVESPADHYSYGVVRRMWANSVFFIQSVLESYRAFIESYSVKMLSLIVQEKKLEQLQDHVMKILTKIKCNIDFSRDSLKVDLVNVKRNQFSSVVDSNLSQVWNSHYREIDENLAVLTSEAEVLLPTVNPIVEEFSKLKDFEDPGQVHCDKLTDLLVKGRKLYSNILRLPAEARNKIQDSSEMVEVIYDSWDVIGDISNDEPFKQHLEELSKTDQQVTGLVKQLNSLYGKLTNLCERVKKTHVERQKKIWTIAERACVINDPPTIQRSQSEHNGHPPPSRGRIRLGENWSIPSGGKR